MTHSVSERLRQAPAPVQKAWKALKKGFRCAGLISLVLVAALLLLAPAAHAASIDVDLGGDGTTAGADTLQLLFLFVVLAVAPFLLLMMTSFTRIVIVFSFLRSAIGLQSTPPNQVIVGLALALTLFIMAPVFSTINTQSVQPLLKSDITATEAVDRAQKPLKEFMLKQTKAKDLSLFLSISGQKLDAAEDDTLENPTAAQLESLGMEVIVPAFITSELKRAFTMGFLLYLPFLIIDMIVSSTLMSMGMVMLPPTTIALPFKLMLFVLVDGWDLLMDMLVRSFR